MKDSRCHHWLKASAAVADVLVPRMTFPAEQAWPTRTSEGIVDAIWTPDSPQVYCPRCGGTTGPGEVTATGCRRCHDRKLPWDRLVRLSAYQPPVAFWIRLFKYHRKWAWGPWFGRHLAEAIPASSEPARNVLVPVPLHWMRQWGRGYNQARLLAQGIARIKGWPVPQAVRRHRGGKPQALLQPSQRKRNVKDRFRLHRRAQQWLGGFDVWLIDDVKTSGATLGACAQLVRAAGARSVQVAVIAVAERDHF